MSEPTTGTLEVSEEPVTLATEGIVGDILIYTGRISGVEPASILMRGRDGAFLVNGRHVTDDKEIYEAFRKASVTTVGRDTVVVVNPETSTRGVEGGEP